MEFVFRISNYDDPALDAEAAELLRQRLERESRRVMPGMWKVTDRLNAYAAKGPGRESRRRRYRIYGVFLIALGLVALVPGLMELRTPSLIWAGGFAVFAGIVEFLLVRKRKPPAVPASCRKEAEAMLAKRRAVDWDAVSAEVRFGEDGMTVFGGEGREAVPYGKMTGLFQTERLWMVLSENEQAVILQKKDMSVGNPEKFAEFLLKSMGL